MAVASVAHHPISELGERLLSAGDPALLEQSLDKLSAAGLSDAARLLFEALHESGEARSLRDALSGQCLARWVEETCTASEEHTLLQQLQRWLGQENAGTGPDDPARLVVLEAMPDDPKQFVTWARRNGVVDELLRPVDEVLRFDGTEVLGLALPSVLEACCPDYAAESGARPSELRALSERTRAYLRGQAATSKALAAREALWQKPWPEGPLRLLGERLHALLPRTAPAALHAERFVTGRPVALDLETGICRGILHTDGDSTTARLWLSGYEDRAIEARCELCSELACRHVAALAARLIDACKDPQDPLRRSLTEFTRVPSWQRFVDALSGGAPAQATNKELVALGYSVRIEEGRCSVAVFKQKEAPKLAAPLRLLRSNRVDDRDRAVLEAMSARTRTLGPIFVQADLALLRSLVEHPMVQRESDGTALRITEEALEIQLLEQPEGLAPSVTLAGMPIASAATPLGSLQPAPTSRDSFVLREDRARRTLVFAALPAALQRMLTALEHFRGVLPKESFPALAARLSELRSVARIRVPQALQGYEHPAPERLLLRIAPLADAGVEVALCVRVFPLSPLWTPGEGTEHVEGVVEGVRRFSRRALARERERSDQVVQALKLDEHTSIARCVYRIDSHGAALEVLSRAAQLHETLDLEWAEASRRLRISHTVKRGDLHIRLFKRGSWLALSGAARSGEAELAIGRLIEAVRRGERFVQVQGDDYAEIEQNLFSLLQDAQLCVSSHDRQLALALSAAPHFVEQLGAEVCADDADSEAWRVRFEQRGEQRETALPALPLHDQLRDYQRDGVRFLLQLATWAPGALLADDMGLGKTIQAIALLVQRAPTGPALVVAPTSLVSNWSDELTRFAPELRPLVYRGTQRERALKELGPQAVLITSYETLLRDAALFEGLTFGTQIIDEAQTIRNARTRRAHAVAGIRASFRVALTGTPIENRLGDLWSLFALVAPGLLGSWARFRALFAVPIERYEDRARAERLRRMVEPFTLRRTKDQVARELPARTEVIHNVELSAPEQQLYTAALTQARQALGKSRKKNDQPYALHILAELTRLRQLACHPRLVLADSRIESSKLQALLRLLEDILPRGHRALIFSQFTQHLGLVREALESRKIRLLYLDGSTPAGQRAELIEQFQAGAAEVFLISLKAGGTGLNLTAADYVIHMDPWWNPAAEDQASDRAHRIGQVKPVTIVKLVAQNTIEERVLGLHEHKRKLAREMLSGEGGNVTLDEEALEALLDD